MIPASPNREASPKPLPFEQRLEIGREHEKAIARLLMSQGNKVLAVYDFTGSDGDKAPKLRAAKPMESLITPDLLLTKDGKSMWCEVKYKKCYDFTYKTQQHETGLPRRAWDNYLNVERESGIPVLLIFVHEAEDDISGEMISILNQPRHHRFYDGPKMNEGGMVFFPVCALSFIAKLSDALKLK